MPIYEYECETCGVFSEFRKLSEYREPAHCSSCGELAERIISVPNLAVMDKSMRSVHERNEKSANAPDIKRKSSCGCSGSHTCKTGNKTSAPSNPEVTPFQMQTKKSARPWMLGH